MEGILATFALVFQMSLSSLPSHPLLPSFLLTPQHSPPVPSSLIMISLQLSQIKKLAGSSIKKGSLFPHTLNLDQPCDFHGNDILQFPRRPHFHPLRVLRSLCFEKIWSGFLEAARLQAERPTIPADHLLKRVHNRTQARAPEEPPHHAQSQQ